MNTLKEITEIFEARNEDKRNFYHAKFTIDNQFFANGITDGQRWNGWECPYFNLEEAKKVLASQEEKNLCIENNWSFYELSGDGLHILEFAEGEISVGYSILFEGQRYFPIGRYNWVWETAFENNEEDEK